jgi:hypothetical protein
MKSEDANNATAQPLSLKHIGPFRPLLLEGWCIVIAVSPPTKISSSSLTRDSTDAD